MFKTPVAAWRILKEGARHVLRRPVVGIAAFATTPDGRVLLIRRGDTRQWALPGGTLEWGEQLSVGITRELLEETGARVLRLGELLGVYSDPGRDPRFHAVTVVVHAEVSQPESPASNHLEVLEVRAFPRKDLPKELSLGMSEMLAKALKHELWWE